VDQGNAQGGGDVLQMLGTESRCIIHIELSWKPAAMKKITFISYLLFRKRSRGIFH
jgi:hypothetical protein